jgi:hypothetical protein
MDAAAAAAAALWYLLLLVGWRLVSPPAVAAAAVAGWEGYPEYIPTSKQQQMQIQIQMQFQIILQDSVGIKGIMQRGAAGQLASKDGSWHVWVQMLQHSAAQGTSRPATAHGRGLTTVTGGLCCTRTDDWDHQHTLCINSKHRSASNNWSVPLTLLVTLQQANTDVTCLCIPRATAFADYHSLFPQNPPEAYPRGLPAPEGTL